MALLLGLTTALAYGTADFLARFSTRRVGVPQALVGALLSGSLALSLWLMVSPTDWAKLFGAWPWLVLSGVLTCGMLALLYAALERGPLSIASPVVSSHPALVMLLLFGLGVRPSAREWIGLSVVLGACVLLSTQVDRVGAAQSLPASHVRKTAFLAAACAFTLSFQILCVQHAARQVGALGAAWGSRIFALLSAVALLPLTHGARRFQRGALGLTALQGLLDVTAVLALAAGTHDAQRALVPVIGSAFGAVTVLLARVFLKEAMTLPQWASIGVLLGGLLVLGWP
jgi:drug/metabolite transporter (DMT)-like permease